MATVWVLLVFLAVPAESQVSGTQAKPRALLVVAHPDDEYEMAGTIYDLAQELSRTVDQLIVTDGEAGFRYSSLAEQYYGVKLTDEVDGRRELPRIRREEAHRAARVLGIEHQWFLNEKDDHFTLDPDEVLKKSWNREHVLKSISERLRQGHYDYVFVLLPVADTHGVLPSPPIPLRTPKVPLRSSRLRCLRMVNNNYWALCTLLPAQGCILLPLSFTAFLDTSRTNECRILPSKLLVFHSNLQRGRATTTTPLLKSTIMKFL